MSKRRASERPLRGRRARSTVVNSVRYATPREVWQRHVSR